MACYEEEQNDMIPVVRRYRKMNQIKIGTFLKELRKDNNLTQEQIAEIFGVSQRSVSRWENGDTMPDISVLIELADYYDVDLREILNGERKTEIMNEDLKETLELVADYTTAEKEKITKELFHMIVCFIPLFLILGVIASFQLTRISDAFGTFAASCSSIGIVYAIRSLISVKQLTNKVNKSQVKKIFILMIAIGLVILAMTMLLILWAVGVIG